MNKNKEFNYKKESFELALILIALIEEGVEK